MKNDYKLSNASEAICRKLQSFRRHTDTKCAIEVQYTGIENTLTGTRTL